MNTPGTTGCWTWRYDWDWFPSEMTARLARLTAATGRASLDHLQLPDYPQGKIKPGADGSTLFHSPLFTTTGSHIMTIRLTIWNEGIHEKTNALVKKLYPNGMHNRIAEGIAAPDLKIRTATLDEPEHGLTEAVLKETDVLIWWGHMAHGKVEDAIVDRSSVGFGKGWASSSCIPGISRRFSAA